MPNWGLTKDQIKARPWGIDPRLREPCKTITDPVHRDIYVNKFGALVADRPPMQRLRRVSHLGTSHHVYPSATHTRLSHSLGTMRSAQDLLDAIWTSRNNP